jgi:hypothetical protein
MATTVEIQSRLTLVDQLSARLNSVASQAEQFHSRMQRLSNKTASMGISPGSLLGTLSGLATGGLAYHMVQGQVELDKIAKQTQAITEISDAKFADARKRMGELGDTFGKKPKEMMEGLKAWNELGNSVESYIENVQIAARTSRVTGIAIGEQMAETSAIMRAFGANPADHEKFKEYERTYLVGSKGMLHGAKAYGEAMKNFAPIAKSMGLDVNQASSLVQVLGGVFQPGEIGTAYRTGFARLMAPTPKAVANMRAAGIDPLAMWGFDEASIKASGPQFAERLRAMHQAVSPQLAGAINKTFQEADLAKGSFALTDKLAALMRDAYSQVGHKGKKSMSGDTSKMLTAAISQHLGSLKGNLNIPALMEALYKNVNNVPLYKELFGARHISKFQDLARQGEHLTERMAKNKEFADSVVNGQDVIGRRSGITMRGLAFEADRVAATWDRMWGILSGNESTAGQGGASGIAQLYMRIADALAGINKGMTNMRAEDMEKFINSATTAGGAAIGLGALALALKGIAGSMAVIGANAPLLAGIGAGVAMWQKHQLSEKRSIDDAARLSAADEPGGIGRKAEMMKILKERNPGLFADTAPPGLGDRIWGGLKRWWNGSSDANAPGWTPGAPNYALPGAAAQAAPKVEGSVSVSIKVEGPGTITSSSATGAARLDTGRSMTDTGRGIGHQ